MGSGNWIVDNLNSALGTWNGKLAEIWQLLSTTPENFKGGGVWTVMQDINGALQAIGCALLVLFFVMGVVKTCGSFTELKKPEMVFKCFIRFVLAQAAVTHGMELMTALFKVAQGMISTIMTASGLSALTDTEVTKWAFNAQFERVCLSRWLGMPVGEYLDPASWRCTMVWAATLGLPLSLEGVGAVLGLEKQKLKEGKDLVRCFCTPAKDRDGIALDVAMVLSAAKVKVTALSARSMADGYAVVHIELEVKDKEELASITNKLNNIQGVYQVVRATGK